MHSDVHTVCFLRVVKLDLVWTVLCRHRMHAYRCRAYCIYTYIGISAGSACLTTQSCATTSRATRLSAKTAGDDVVGSADGVAKGLPRGRYSCTSMGMGHGAWVHCTLQAHVMTTSGIGDREYAFYGMPVTHCCSSLVYCTTIRRPSPREAALPIRRLRATCAKRLGRRSTTSAWRRGSAVSHSVLPFLVCL